MEKEQVINELEELVQEGERTVLPTKWYPTGVIGSHYYVDGPLYSGWHSKVISFLKLVLSEESDYVVRMKGFEENYYSYASSAISVLKAIIEYINKGFLKVGEIGLFNSEVELQRIFKRFYRIARQLRSRYNRRNTLEIGDEYDVQDLLHALLRLYYDDIRAEEWTPSYAGKSARMDFLIKSEQIVIEVKKTRAGLTDKEIGDQLIVDVDRYKAHPDCQRLICFVYDPEGLIGNPIGMMKDLNERHEGFVKVVIEPSD